ncbi:fimbrial biogenesis outer membrane usher protein [Serratia symbiotica str. 'Cinara cedri']|nr:fimbrial biogenesis outer membrane usher protein [Serratia symbiotica str. 'Cinara cedri']
MLFLFSNLAIAKEVFNTSFIHGDNNVAQVVALGEGDDILPGIYPFDIYLNGYYIDHRNIEFKKLAKNTPVVPCLIAQDYQNYGIKLPDHLFALQCYVLSEIIPGAQLSYDAAIQRIDLSIPQFFLVSRPQGAILSKDYDHGINAGFINYNFNRNYNRRSNTQYSKTIDSYFLSLTSGLNFGSWRIRNNSAITHQSGIGYHWKNISSSAEVDIVPLRSHLVVGLSSTPKVIFNSIQFSGIQLSSINEMLAESQRGYMPVVRGIVLNNACIEIYQNGYMIYSTNVPPGPFALIDIPSTTLNGDLNVIVIETNGSTSNFVVPFSIAPNMLREGIWNYQFTTGKYHDGISRYQPNFMQATLSYGMTYGMTPYGGILVSKNYHSLALGLSKNLGAWGAISFDTSYYNTNLVNSADKQKKSYRILYSKFFNQSNTELQIASYHYLDSHTYDFSDIVAAFNGYKDSYQFHSYYSKNNLNIDVPGWLAARRRIYYTNCFRNKRQYLELTINQHLAISSTLYANFSNQSYWGGMNNDYSAQIGFNSSYKNISYSLFYQDDRSNYGYNNHSINMTISTPLNFFSKNSSDMSASFNSGYNKQNGNTYNVSLNGTAMEDNLLNYSVQHGYDRHSSLVAAASVGYQGNIGIINTGYSYSHNYQQYSLRIAGGIIAHDRGITLTQPLQNSFILVEALQAKGVRLENQFGVSINCFGYAVMTSASPYRHNRVALRSEDISNSLDIPMLVKDVVPTNGAIVRVKFDTNTGQSLLIHSKTTDNSLPPIGANVFSLDGKNKGIVGTNGEIYISGALPGDRLLVKWGQDVSEICSLLIPDLQYPTKEFMGYQELSLYCKKL